MGALDSVHAVGPADRVWRGTESAVLVSRIEGDGEQTVAGSSGKAAPNVGAAEALNSVMGHPGEPSAGNPAWMAPLTELPDRAFQYQIELRVDQETGRVVARVIDRESGEVVRQVPPEHVLQLATYIDEWLGRVLDARV